MTVVGRTGRTSSDSEACNSEAGGEPEADRTSSEAEAEADEAEAEAGIAAAAGGGGEAEPEPEEAVTLARDSSGHDGEGNAGEDESEFHPPPAQLVPLPATRLRGVSRRRGGQAAGDPVAAGLFFKRQRTTRVDWTIDETRGMLRVLNTSAPRLPMTRRAALAAEQAPNGFEQGKPARRAQQIIDKLKSLEKKQVLVTQSDGYLALLL